MAVKNLSSGTLVSSISASTSSLSVYVGEGTNSEIMSVWPNTPFYATIMPASPSAGVPNRLDSEIILVSGVSVDGNGNTTLSVSRGERGTTAKAFSAGDIITNASYTEDVITNDKVDAGAVTKVGTDTVGGTAIPIYLNSGTPTAVNKPASGSWFKGVPDISSGGVMEVGKYLDFHNANGDTSDYAVRLQTQGNNQVAVNLPTTAGTLALTSQLPTSSSNSIQIGSVLIQWGKATVSTNISNTTINLGTSYGNTNYNVIVSAGFNEAGESYWWSFFTTKANQSFTCRAGYKQVNSGGGGKSNCEVDWITIGVIS